MTYGITINDLRNLLERINFATDQNIEAWTKQEDGTYKANPGTYILNQCYGGVRLAQICNTGGGERDITWRGTKRETYRQMQAFLAGLDARANP